MASPPLRVWRTRPTQAYEANPEAGMMVEYPHLPEGIVDMVLPEHFKVEVSPYEHQRMMNSTKMYSKVRY